MSVHVVPSKTFLIKVLDEHYWGLQRTWKLREEANQPELITVLHNFETFTVSWGFGLFNHSFIFIFYLYRACVCMCMCVFVYLLWLTYGKDNFGESVLSFHHVGFGDRTQVYLSSLPNEPGDQS